MRSDTPTLRQAGILLGILFIVAALSACSDDQETVPRGGDGAWDEYVSWCSWASLEVPSIDEATYGEVSAFYAGVIERMRSTAPPAEAADWHNKYMDSIEAMNGSWPSPSVAADPHQSMTCSSSRPPTRDGCCPAANAATRLEPESNRLPSRPFPLSIRPPAPLPPPESGPAL